MHSWDVAPDGKFAKARLHPAVSEQESFETQAPSFIWPSFPRYVPFIVATAQSCDAVHVWFTTGSNLIDSIVDLIPLLQIRWSSKENY